MAGAWVNGACVMAVVVAACAGGASTARPYLARFGAQAPKPESFAVCWGYGCPNEAAIDLTAAWAELGRAFALPPADAAAERVRIAAAVGLWERAAAGATPIGGDLGGTFGGVGHAGQLDCVDETVNTTRLLVMIENAGFLRFHRTRMPATRGAFVFGWPHTTAVLEERSSGARFAIDSWFHDNGTTAEVVPIAAWQAGWSP
ncbi:MAG: hypothetical protein ACREER_03565 [Alphaproteobacteria bacterium]